MNHCPWCYHPFDEHDYDDGCHRDPQIGTYPFRCTCTRTLASLDVLHNVLPA